MSDVTTDDLLRDLVTTCQSSVVVESYSIIARDDDTLNVRVILRDQSFIHVYYNIAIGKVAFAWIQREQRIYGKDNARRAWHKHPFDATQDHVPCESIDFKSFVREVELLWKQSQNKSV